VGVAFVEVDPVANGRPQIRALYKFQVDMILLCACPFIACFFPLLPACPFIACIYCL
jgi:hypothetical protein